MATCPPPPSTLGPPPVPTIDAFGGLWKVAFPIFEQQAKREVAGQAMSDLHYSTTLTVSSPPMNFAGTLGAFGLVPGQLQAKTLIHPLVKAGFDAAVKKSKALWKIFLDTPTAWTRTGPRVGVETPTVETRTTPPPPGPDGFGWKAVYGNRDRAMTSIISGEPQWRTAIGVVQVAVMPQSVKIFGVTRSETAKAFTARGGYLLHRDTLIAQPGHRVALESIQPSWVPKHDDTIEKFNTYVLYNVAAGKATLVMALRNPTGWQRAWDIVVNAARWACSKITSDKLSAAAAYAGTAAGASGPGATAVAGWTAAASICGLVFPKCTPGVPEAEATLPPGSIAWLDSSLGQYRIAVPAPVGSKPTHTEMGVMTTPPLGVEVVGRFRWEAATRPWYRQTIFIGAGAGLVVAGASATVLTLRR